MEEQQKKKKRKKIHEVDLETDIRYRGPLSDRSFKILGWLCLALSQIVMLFNLVSGIAPGCTDSRCPSHTAVFLQQNA